MKKHLGGLYSVTFVDGTTKTGELLEHKVTGGVDHYYVHYVDFDRRLDDWVPADRIDLSAQDLDRHAVAAEVGDAAGSPGRRKRKLEGAAGGEALNGGAYRHQHHRGAHSMDPTLFARLEAEREEITKVKNIPCIQLGRWEIEAWYYSPFPERCRGKKLYICEYTLKVRRRHAPRGSCLPSSFLLCALPLLRPPRPRPRSPPPHPVPPSCGST
jgi:histone acetyltransferase MYST1